MLVSLTDKIWHRVRSSRGASLAVVNLRILLGFAFLPAGLKKLLGQRFTDAANHGPFHDFLHAFFATGGFYRFVGVMQLVVALLLMSQRFALVGALGALPIFTAILVFCWSTQVYFTAVMVTLMWLGTLGLLSWDAHRLAPLIGRHVAPPGPPSVDLALWARCGFAVFALYLVTCALAGGVYRPRGLDLRAPAFYVFPTIALLPVLTFVIERRRRGTARP